MTSQSFEFAGSQTRHIYWLQRHICVRRYILMPCANTFLHMGAVFSEIKAVLVFISVKSLLTWEELSQKEHKGLNINHSFKYYQLEEKTPVGVPNVLSNGKAIFLLLKIKTKQIDTLILLNIS